VYVFTHSITHSLLLVTAEDRTVVVPIYTGWRRSVVVSGVGLINEVNRHWARLVLGWVTACGG